jgi:hypothetical protein
MTWTCPNCERRYPDSGIGVPEDAETFAKTACHVCIDESDDETDVYLNRFDMDHLAAGQPVFKAGDGDDVIALRFEEPGEWNRTPNEELRELVEELRERQKECTLASSGITGEGAVYKECADELAEVIEDD